MTDTYEQLQQYAKDHTSRESESLQFIVKATAEELQYDDMLSGRQVAGLLRLLIQTGNLKQILEVGMFTGYATLSMAEVLPEGGRITTLEMNTLYKSVAERAFSKSGLADRIEIIFGNARETCVSLEGGLDLIFLDADKQYYPEYYKILKPKLTSGGLFVIDNVFWHGGVLEPSDRKSRAIDELNNMIAKDDEMETVMLDIRDGITISRKKPAKPISD